MRNIKFKILYQENLGGHQTHIWMGVRDSLQKRVCRTAADDEKKGSKFS